MEFWAFWQKAQRKIPVDFARALTDDVKAGTLDLAVVQEYFTEAKSYVPASQLNNEIANAFCTDYVIARLYERYGYLEQAKYFRELANAELAKMGESLAGESGWRPPKSHSEAREFTREVLDKW